MKFLSSFVIVLLSLFCLNTVNAQVPPQDTTYDVTFQSAGAVLQQLDMNGGILLSSGDDVNDIVSIGFDFVFFGNTFNTVNVSSNGFLSFSDFGNGCCGGELQFGSPNTIYALWMDLVANNSTYYKTYNINGQSVFTAGWYNAYELGSPSTFHNFEISLYSGTNDFKITYGNNMAPAYPYSAGIVGPMGEIWAIQPYGIDQTVISNTTYTFSLAAPPPPPPPEPPLAVDCTLAPSDPRCVINNIIDQTTDPMLADNTTVTPEQSVAMFEEPVTDTPAEEPVAVVEEQPLEELLAAPVEQQVVADVVQEQTAEETIVAEETTQEVVEETQEDEKEEAVVAAASESSGGTMDPSLLSLVLSIVDATSAVGTTASVTAGPVSSSVASSSSSSAQTSSAAANISIDNNPLQATASLDFIGPQQEQQLSSIRSDSSSVASSSSSSETKSGIESELKEISELLATTIDNTQVTADLNNPVVSAATNLANNPANQEAAGLLNFNEEYKVSMNDDSSENFMGEDQSNTIDAMSAGVDFSSYTSAMLFDASAWYKPEDIYRNNKISDNARSLYFLQKGSSDTFNQMVQEQYK